MKRKKVRNTTIRTGKPEYRRMLGLLFCAAFVVTLGLVHIQLRLATRDMAIQRSRYQVERKKLYNKRDALASEVAQLSSGDRILEYARAHLQLMEVPVDQIRVLPMPRQTADKYERNYTEIALARTGEMDHPQNETLVARLLGTVLSPEAQAQPASPGR